MATAEKGKRQKEKISNYSRVHVWQTGKKLFFATFTTSVPLREPVSELWGQFLRLHGSVRPYINDIIFPNRFLSAVFPANI